MKKYLLITIYSDYQKDIEYFDSLDDMNISMVSYIKQWKECISTKVLHID